MLNIVSRDQGFDLGLWLKFQYWKFDAEFQTLNTSTTSQFIGRNTILSISILLNLCFNDPGITQSHQHSLF